MSFHLSQFGVILVQFCQWRKKVEIQAAASLTDLMILRAVVEEEMAAVMVVAVVVAYLASYLHGVLLNSYTYTTLLHLYIHIHAAIKLFYSF